jgi:hypothetical protein
MTVTVTMTGQQLSESESRSSLVRVRDAAQVSGVFHEEEAEYDNLRMSDMQCGVVCCLSYCKI